MRKVCIFFAVALTSGAATAQNSSTNCYAMGSTVQCNTQTTPGINWGALQQQQQQQQLQNQQNMNQAFANLGAAIAARRERKREEQVAAAAAAAQAATAAAVAAAQAADTATMLPPPVGEAPVLLICTVNGSPASVALYEKHSRVDTTSMGVTKTREAAFSTEAVTWTTPLARFSLNRLDGSYAISGNIPELASRTITGMCNVASQRKF